MTRPAELLHAALSYAAEGWKVFPLFEINAAGACACGSAGCTSPGKHPRSFQGVLNATTDEATIRKWWGVAPNANIGGTGPVVIDIDNDTHKKADGTGKDGFASLAALEAEHGELPPTRTHRSGSNGAHLIFARPDVDKVANGSDVFGKGSGIDVKGDGGYVVLPPSNHASGGHYEVLDALPFAPLPTWIMEALAKGKPAKERVAAPPPADVTEEDRLWARAELGKVCAKQVTSQGSTIEEFKALARLAGGYAWALGEDACVEAFAGATAARGTTLGDAGRQIANLVAIGAEDPILRGVNLAALGSFSGGAAQEKTDGARASGVIEWIHGAEMAEPLMPTHWMVPALQICAGRPCLLAGYGASGKTLAGQDMLLAFAARGNVWGRFPTLGRNAIARHFDHEQGRHATVKRYQRLAAGRKLDLRDLDERLAVACFPPIHLNDANAIEAYAKACDGVELVLIDALRGATPGEDENDSGIRRCIDNLTSVSQKTGTAFVVIHHAGKPKEGHSDSRTVARGSSAIFDASGCVLLVSGAKDVPKVVSQQKQPAEAEGGAIEDFELEVQDFEVEGRATGGLRISHKAVEAAVTPQGEFQATVMSVLEFIRSKPGAKGSDAIRREMRIRRGDAMDAVAELLDEGKIENAGTSNRPALYVAGQAPNRLVRGDAD